MSDKGEDIERMFSAYRLTRKEINQLIQRKIDLENEIKQIIEQIKNKRNQHYEIKRIIEIMLNNDIDSTQAILIKDNEIQPDLFDGYYG